ncbi:hypothetical protein [Pseudomonas veronii]
MNDSSDLKAIAEACQQHQPLRFMRSHGALYIRNDNSIVFDVHQNRSFPEFMAQNKDYADLVLAATPETILALIAENEALKGPHDWLAEDLIKELVDNAQAIQENADDGEDDQFVIVLLAAAQRIRRQEANIEKLRAENELLAKTADCWDRLNVQNKALSDSFRAERDQAEQDYKDVVGTIELRDIEISKLRAEVAGLRTGYEAYERVNAELKAENERLERNRDMWKGQVDRQCETIEGLRKALKAAEDAMWHADGNMDGEAADARDALADLGQGEQS